MIADLDGDGTVDVGTATGAGYVAFDGAKLLNAALAGPATVLWAVSTRDCGSGQTGSSAFDFDGDGRAEILYADEQ